MLGGSTSNSNDAAQICDVGGERTRAIAGSAIAGSAIAGSAIAGSAIAGSAIAGSAIAGSAIAGSAIAGSAIDALHARFLRRKREQSAWDAEEARDLRRADQQQIWLRYGCVTLLEYLERFCGIEPRTALERIRVSVALADLPLLEANLEDGTFQFSHVKELTRVVVADTEEEWVQHARGLTYREVQQAVAGRSRGDRPTDPTRPDERRRCVSFQLKPSTKARLLAVLGDIERARGDRFVDDDDAINCMCDLASSALADLVGALSNLAGSALSNSCVSSSESEAAEVTATSAPGASATGASATGVAATRACVSGRETSPAGSTAATATATSTFEPARSSLVVGAGNVRGAARRPCCAPAQVWITSDGHAFANGVEIDDAERDTLLCDATMMGHVDDDSARPRPAFSARKRRRILARDMYQCRVPGCRLRHHLDVHHVIRRADGGDHSDSNLITLCSGHHRLHHGGFLQISGRAPTDLRFKRVFADDEQPSRPRGRGASENGQLAERTRAELAEMRLS